MANNKDNEQEPEVVFPEVPAEAPSVSADPDEIVIDESNQQVDNLVDAEVDAEKIRYAQGFIPEVATPFVRGFTEEVQPVDLAEQAAAEAATELVPPPPPVTAIPAPIPAPAPEFTPAVPAGEAPVGVPAGDSQFFNQQQPIFVQAPVPPSDLNNRLFGVAIGLLATVLFAVLFIAIMLGFEFFVSQGNLDLGAFFSVGQIWTFGIISLAFFISWVIWALITNRAAWGAWASGGIVVAVLTYAFSLFGLWLVAQTGQIAINGNIDPIRVLYLLPTFIVAREVTIWLGAWVAARGAKLNKLNQESRDEYERTLAQHPVVYPGINS